MTRNEHTHPCIHCAAAVECRGVLMPNHDGHPPVVCTTYHLPGGTLAVVRCDRCEVLTELADYFDDRMDINWDGGPNEAMTWHRRIMEVL